MSSQTKSYIYRKIGEVELGLNIQRKNNKYDITFSDPLQWLDEDNREGVIVAQNPLTDAWVNLMILNDEDLVKYSGLTTASDYRQQMIYAICELWD